MQEIRKVVLIGASGVLGSAILQALQDAKFDITVLSRAESKATFSDEVKLVKTSYDFDSFRQAFQGQDAVICATGLSAISQQSTIVDACVAAGVYRYITNDFGNASDFRGLPELELARKPKQDILEYVEKAAQSHSGFTWTALATGHFLDYAVKKFPAFGFNIAERSARLVDGGEEPFSSTTLADIGIAVAGILKEPAGTANKYLLVRTLETTQLQILEAFQHQTGKKWSVSHITSKELYNSGKVLMSQGGGRQAILELLPVQIFERGAGRSTFPPERYDNSLVGLKESTVGEVVHNILSSM